MGCASSHPKNEDEDTAEDFCFENPTSSPLKEPSSNEAAGGNEDKTKQAPIPPPPKRLTLKQLSAATEGFSFQRLLGEGSLGLVYRGEILDPAFHSENAEESAPMVHVAVKKLHQGIFQGYKNYLNEVLTLDRLQHPNLVRLVGYCHEKNEACLAFELCPRGSLAKLLASGDSDGEGLPWSRRAIIALEVGRGLAAMHDNNVIHRDLKAANVLLMDDYTAKVTDFALARAGPDGDQKHVSTKVMGTLGYLDPCYMETGRLSAKSDVYAFGVILLEIITGKPSVDGSVSLVHELSPILEQIKPSLLAHVDPVMGGNFSKIGVQRMTLIARACLSNDSEKRPTMKEIVKTLEKAVSLDPSI